MFFSLPMSLVLLLVVDSHVSPAFLLERCHALVKVVGGDLSLQQLELECSDLPVNHLIHRLFTIILNYLNPCVL